jgi:Lsr2
MAQKVNIVLVDDIDGGDASETVSFALDGVDYEIDLSDKHSADLRDALALYIGHARRTGGRRRGGRRTSASSSSTPAAAGGASAADIRAWARENGWDVPERGRVSADVREAYAAAN